MEVVPYEQYRRSTLLGRVVITETGEPDLPEEWDFEDTETDENFLDEDELLRRQKEIIGVRPTQFVEFAVRVPNKATQKFEAFSFDKRRYLRMPYDTQSKRLLYKCGRQVEKSTLLGNKCLAYCCMLNSFNVLYVAPTNLQAKVFSRDRLKEPIDTSTVLKAWTSTSAKLSDAVFEKQFVNRSNIKLRFAYHNADRTRGIPADLVLLDEIQDINTDNIPVIEQCASHSMHKLFLYAGTPKSLENPIEHYWNKFSTQNEWAVPCERHTPIHWNILDERHIGKKGLICDRCGELIDAMHADAQWVSMNPGVFNSLSPEGVYEGYRIPQLMVPWIPWNEILDNYRKYPSSQFNNEVLGLSHDSGTRPLTRADIIANCRPDLEMTSDGLRKMKTLLGDAFPVYAGIDWGTSENSYTVISLGTYVDQFFTIFYMHRFEGPEADPPIQMELIQKLIDFWKVSLIGVDYGGGFHPNDTLQRRYGRNRVWKYQYSTPSQKVKWDPDINRFLVHRTEVMSDIFNAIKRKNVFRFPNFTQFEDPFARDFLAIFSEYNEKTKQIDYKHAIDTTDDSFHSALYCMLVSMLQRPNPNILNPSAKSGGTVEYD